MTFIPQPTTRVTLFILRGVSGSGKSTIAKRIQDRIDKTIVVSRDDLRLALYNKDFGPPINEGFITVVEDHIIFQAFAAGINVISDNTNLTPRIINDHLSRANEYGVHVILQEVETPLHLAKFMNAERGAKGGRFVPEAVIDNQHELFYQHQDEIARIVEEFNSAL